MDNIRKKYKTLMYGSIIIMCTILSIIYIVFTNGVQSSYRKYSGDLILDVKKSFLKDTVNNIIIMTEQIQQGLEDEYSDLLVDTVKYLKEIYHVAPEDFLPNMERYFNNNFNDCKFNIIVLNKLNSKIVYKNESLIYDDQVDSILNVNRIKASSGYYEEDSCGPYYIFIGIKEDYIKSYTQENLYKKIHSFKFSNHSYIWVNEIIDFEGGDNYAIRLIHPNLKESEGEYLSTNIKDIKGNNPYLVELNGVKEKGEIFFTYYFKKINSDEISEKLSYAKLYDKYNWVISMGVHLDDIGVYIDKTDLTNQVLMKRMIRTIVMFTVFVILVSLSFVYFLEKWYYRNSNTYLKEEIIKDPLTNAFNRRGAVKDLSASFQEYVNNNENSAVILFDIDDFKNVNDVYGHDVGDEVLVSLVSTINQNIRNTDRLYRWGGEEFLLVCNGLEENNLSDRLNRLLEDVSKIYYGDGEKNITISVGASYFKEEDTTFESSLKRADMALYNAKVNGKNQFCIL